MLSLLKIRNLALVDELCWEPHSGFLGITGETGAGKSVIMGGISLVLGERADKSLIRSGESQCSVEAVFRLSQTCQLNALLEEAGIPPCEEGELIIRRIITPTGNRQFINSSPATLQLLRSIAAGLVDMHHPDSHRSLTSQERQLCLLDAFAENTIQLQEYHQCRKLWLALHHERTQLEESERASERELDFLRHQVEEIEQAGFTAEEAEELEIRWQRARNAGRLRDCVIPMLQLLEGSEDSILSRLHQLVRSRRELERMDAAFAERLGSIEDAVTNLEDLAGELQDYSDHLGGDPAEQAALERRISLLDSLKRKYGADFEAISRHLEECRTRLDAISHRDERMEELRLQEEEALKKLRQAGACLRQTREAAIPRLEESFLEHARHLGFRQALFCIRLEVQEEPSPQGMEMAEFLFGPNPGEPVKPLRLIASSGELARVMLALKSALAQQDDTPLLIFDEIDANVGGEIARAVGRKMRELGHGHQVIAITHFPQVAAMATHHYLISKGMENGRTVSRLEEVRGESRIEELVRMLGTDGSSARAHAKALLEEK